MTSNEKIAQMNTQLFNKKNTIIIARSAADELFSDRVSKEVLAGMLANFEALGYKFEKNDIKKMARMSEATLVEQVYEPVLAAAKESKGAHVEHNILFPNFPTSVKNLDIDTLSDFRFLSYFTVIYDEYLAEQNAFADGSLTMSLKDYMNHLSEKENKKEENSETVKVEKKKEKDDSLETIYLGDVTDYYTMINNMLSEKSSLSEYDQSIVKFALANISRDKYMPETIPFKETFALVMKDDFDNHRIKEIDVKSYKDFERLLAVLTPDSDISLSKKNHYRNFTNQERKELFQVFKNALKNNYPIMTESALNRRAKTFTKNVLKNRLHFDKMSGGKEFEKFVEYTDGLRSKMSLYEEKLVEKDYAGALNTLKDISSGAVVAHAKSLVTNAYRDGKDYNALLDSVKESIKDAPMDRLISLRMQVAANLSKEDSDVKFYFKKSKNVIVEPYLNTSEKLPEDIKENFVSIIDDAIKGQLATLEKLDTVYIDPALKECPIPTVGRNDSGKHNTMAMGTKVEFGKDKDILRAALYKKGSLNGFFDFSCAFLDPNYNIVGQISWNNLKEDDFAYHSGDCMDTKHGVTEIIDVNLAKIKERFPDTKYITYEGMAWGNFTTVNQLQECFLTLSNVNEVREGGNIEKAGDFPLDPANIKFKVDLTGNSYANIPILYDIDENKVSFLNLSTDKQLKHYGQPDINRHFNLPEHVQAIENYAGELAQTSYYINERLLDDKMSIYDLAMLNVEARGGELVENAKDAKTVFSVNRVEPEKDQTVISIYDKDVINTDFMVAKMEKASNEIELDMNIIPPEENLKKEKFKDEISL